MYCIITSLKFIFCVFDTNVLQNDVSFAAKSFICIWNVSYPAEKYAPGPYEVDVTVYKIYYFDRKVASNRISFNVTGTRFVILSLYTQSLQYFFNEI